MHLVTSALLYTACTSHYCWKIVREPGTCRALWKYCRESGYNVFVISPNGDKNDTLLFIKMDKKKKTDLAPIQLQMLDMLKMN